MRLQQAVLVGQLQTLPQTLMAAQVQVEQLTKQVDQAVNQIILVIRLKVVVVAVQQVMAEQLILLAVTIILMVVVVHGLEMVEQVLRALLLLNGKGINYEKSTY
jgi:hypothetical protein